jgi:hypothetical protein
MKKRYFSRLILSLTVFPLLLQAQQASKDTLLTREMLLEKEYNPTIRDAARLNTLPEITDPEVPHATVSYANYALPFEVRPQLSTLKAEEYFTRLKASDKRGYVLFGMANNLNVTGDLGYQILLEEKTRLSVFYEHRSAGERLTYLQADEKQRMKLNDNLGGLHFSHLFNPFTLSARLKYTDSRFNYYGYTAPLPGLPFPALPVDKTVNQKNSLLNIDLGVVSGKEQEVNYSINLNIAGFRQQYSLLQSMRGPREALVHTDWDVNTAFGDLPVGIGGYFNLVSYSRAKDPVANANFAGYDDYGQLSLNPYADYDGDNWKVHIGARTHFYISHGRVLSLAPDVAFSFFPATGSEIYLTAGGGITTNTRGALMAESRYLSPFFRAPDSQTPIDAAIGFKSSIRGIAWIDLYAGYKVSENEHFPASAYPLAFPVYPLSFAGGSGNTLIAGHALTADVMDAKLLKIGLKAKYSYQDVVEVSARLQHNTWDVKNASLPHSGSSKAWNKPVLEGDLNIACTLDRPLRFDLTYHLETGRKALWNSEVQRMKDIHDLNLKVTYALNDAFSVFAQTNNVLCRRYDLWYGYPAQGVRVLLGGSVKF